MKINKKLEKLINITSSVSEQETNETCFINEINEENMDEDEFRRFCDLDDIIYEGTKVAIGARV